MKKVLVLLIAFLFIFAIFGDFSSSETEKPEKENVDMIVHEPGDCFTIDNHFTFCIPLKTLSSERMLLELQNENELIHLFQILDDDSIKAPSSVCVSIYTNDVPVTLDSAFYYALSKRHVDDKEEDYRLISSGKYTIGGRSFYHKISIRGGDICSIMHYFMKNDFSTTVYEIKVSGSPFELSRLKALAEDIVLSAHFKQQDHPEDEPANGVKVAHLNKQYPIMIE